MQNQAMNSYIRKARDAGMPKDQVREFVRANYVALPKMLPFHAAAREADLDGGPVILALGGARGPGKSHACLAQGGLDDCQRKPGLKGLFLRNIQKSATESMEDLVRRLFNHIAYDFRAHAGRVEFANESRIVIGGFGKASDIDKYVGIEYDFIILEEMNMLMRGVVDKLRGSMRTSRDDWRPRLYCSFNPGGVGHGEVRRWIVDPYLRGSLPSSIRFFPGTYKDNPFLDKEYVKWLEELPGPLGRAWRDGDFNVFEGMAFPNWDDSVHVVKPFTIPDHWLRWRAVDWGYANPFCCLWFAQSPTNRQIVVYREAYAINLTDAQQAERINQMTQPGENVQVTYADPSMWQRKVLDNYTGSTADVYMSYGIALTKADNDRIGGKRKVDTVLAPLPDGQPGLVIFSTCANLIRTLPSLPYDQYQAEDVDTNAEDHAYDGLRYGLTNYQPQALAQLNKPTKRTPSPLEGLRL